jgi:hypothetical protein
MREGWANVGAVLFAASKKKGGQAMHNDEAIIAAYHRAIQPGVPDAFVFRRDYHMYIATRVTHDGRSFILRVAESLPSMGGWVIEPMSKANLEKQTRDFINWPG